jgi:ribonuclease HI
MLPFLCLGESIEDCTGKLSWPTLSVMKKTPPTILYFALDTDLGSSLLQLTDAPELPLEIIKQSITSCADSPPITSVWKIFFDGASSREGVGVGLVFVSPTQENIPLSYKLEFETTNNVAEYEALVLGLRVAKDMGIKEISVFGDAELIVNQIRNIYQAKHPRLRTYRNEVWDLIDSFFLAFNISFIPREENTWLILWLFQQAISEFLCHLNSSMI